jgi:hypothetical protein
MTSRQDFGGPPDPEKGAERGDRDQRRDDVDEQRPAVVRHQELADLKAAATDQDCRLCPQHAAETRECPMRWV